MAEDSKIVFPVLKRGLIAILRGIKPSEAEAIADVLIMTGFEAIEVPLNSPQPFHSIEIMSRKYSNKAYIGAGTVLRASEVDEVVQAGGRLIISPNIDKDVVGRAVSLGAISMPGVFTPTEAHLALQSGASALKFFPASVLGPQGISAIQTILPSATVVGAVGGVDSGSFADYWRVGVRVFGVGSNLYKPGDNVQSVKEKAKSLIEAYDNLGLH